MPWVRSDLCAGCGACLEACPFYAIDMTTGKAEIDQDRCTKCGRCIPACPQEAIRPNSENPALAGGFAGTGAAAPGRGMGRGKGRGGGFGRGGGGGRAMGR